MLCVKRDQEWDKARSLLVPALLGMMTILFSIITVSYVNAAEVEKVTVEQGDIETLHFSLQKGQSFEGSLIVVVGNEIDFWIRSPNGDYVIELDRINREVEFEFVAEESGVYVGIFRNLFSSQSAIIELSYDIYSPTVRIDISTLFLIIGGLVAIIVIVIWWKS